MHRNCYYYYYYTVSKCSHLMTLNGDYALCFKNVFFGAHHENLNEEKPILSTAKM